jgi:hypothetical protein
MKILQLLGLYAIAGFLLGVTRRLEMTSGVEALVSMSASIMALVAPVLIHGWLDRRFVMASVETSMRDWCSTHGKDFEQLERFKNHFALTYRDGPSKARRKFRVHFRPFRWTIRNVDWLDH